MYNFFLYIRFSSFWARRVTSYQTHLSWTKPPPTSKCTVVVANSKSFAPLAVTHYSNVILNLPHAGEIQLFALPVSITGPRFGTLLGNPQQFVIVVFLFHFYFLSKLVMLPVAAICNYNGMNLGHGVRADHKELNELEAVMSVMRPELHEHALLPRRSLFGT